MSTETIHALRERLNRDDALRERFAAIEPGPESLDQFLRLAAEAGFPIRHADVVAYMREKNTEMSDAQLDAVAGGVHYVSFDGGTFDFQEPGTFS